jgi:hypothetical protein
MIWIAAKPHRMWIVAAGQPMHYIETVKVRYACSWPFWRRSAFAIRKADLVAAGLALWALAQLV